MFPLVWITLYIAMSYAAMRVALIDGSQQALGLRGMQTP